MTGTENAPRAPKRVVLVLGMHRSGTSALTRALALAGAHLPTDMLPSQPDNPDGFFEPRAVMLIHEALLSDLGLSWDHEAAMPAAWFASPQAADYRAQLGAVLDQELAGKTDVLLKDPRMCRLMPLWRDLLTERNIGVAVVLTVRHPREVAASLAARNAMPAHCALLLWLRYTLEAERGSRGLPRCVVLYDTLMHDGAGTLRRIGITLGIGATDGSSIDSDAVAAFLSGGRRHHRVGSDALEQPPALAALVDETYALLTHAAEAGTAPDAAALDAISMQLDRAEAVFGPYVREGHRLQADLQAQAIATEAAHATLAERQATLTDTQAMLADTRARLADAQAMTAEARLAAVDAQRVIGEIRHTWSWRLTRPLRGLAYVARGRFDLASRGHVPGPRAIWRNLIPRPLRDSIWIWRQRRLAAWHRMTVSAANAGAIQALADARAIAARPEAPDPLRAPAPDVWPEIDLSIVTYNNGRWLAGFFASLAAQDYPLSRVHLRAVDNASTDDTATVLAEFLAQFRDRLASAQLSPAANLGFGAGHNTAIGTQGSALVLISNVDLEFRADTITRLVSVALADGPDVALWEARQAPYEHPKYYEPVTGFTNWSAFACVLLRRAAFAGVGGFDPQIFLYGEDVDLSYRLRGALHRLRYVAPATCVHHAYAQANEVKPAQYRGGLFANLYLRLRFGRVRDVGVTPLLAAQALSGPEPYPGARRDARRAMAAALGRAPALLGARLLGRTRQAPGVYFPFRRWDYDLTRPGAFVPVPPVADAPPLISVVVRTYAGREMFLAQALLSIAHQTWQSLEILVVEDGGASMAPLIQAIAARTGRTIRHLPQAKMGRSGAGNAGLAATAGALIGFLDDDDLFFHDHLEILAGALAADPEAVAAYALAFEVRSAADPATQSIREEDFSISLLHQQEFDFPTLVHHNYMSIQAVLFRRACYDQRGGFEEDMDALEDWNLWLRYAYGNRFVHVPKATSLFRTPADDAVREARQAVLNAAIEPVAARNADAIDLLKGARATTR